MGTFAIKDDFYLNGERFKLISGSIHYFRVPPDYWRDRLVKLKNMGCNTVETYIPWNGHEPHKGKFCFTGLYDVEAFVRLAQSLGLWVMLRPSPYICAHGSFSRMACACGAAIRLISRMCGSTMMCSSRAWFRCKLPMGDRFS